jgi:hypothetical protein
MNWPSESAEPIAIGDAPARGIEQFPPCEALVDGKTVTIAGAETG